MTARLVLAAHAPSARPPGVVGSSERPRRLNRAHHLPHKRSLTPVRRHANTLANIACRHPAERPNGRVSGP